MISNIKKHVSMYTVLLFIIILIAVFFRFYNTPNRYGFDYDPTRDALIVDYASKTLHFPLIGPPSGIGPFTFGPWYYYQLIFFKIIFPVDYSPWIYIGILSTISVFIMYKIGILLRGKTLGLILAALTALSPAETGQIRALSNPTLIPLYASLTIWIFVLFFKKNPSLWLALIWGLILGIGINNHYQMLGLLLFPIILFIYKKDKRWLRILAFIAGISITLVPLLLFNIFHGWDTVRGVIFYVTQGKNAVYFPNRWLYYVVNFWPMFWSYVLGVPEQLGVAFMLYSGAIISYLFIKRKLEMAYVFIGLVFGINFLLLRNFPIKLEYYYLLYLHPLIFTIFGSVIWLTFSFKMGRYIGFLILSTVLIGMTLQSIDRLRTAADQTQFKREAQRIMNDYPNKKFVLYECSKDQRSRVRGVEFFINISNKISEDGIKIAYPDEKCQLPLNSKLSVKYLNDIEALDISYASDASLFKYGWKMVTPKTVFDQLFQSNFLK